jgi:hypothetical protein
MLPAFDQRFWSAKAVCSGRRPRLAVLSPLHQPQLDAEQQQERGSHDGKVEHHRQTPACHFNAILTIDYRAKRESLDAGVLLLFPITYAMMRSRNDLVEAIAAVLAEQRHRLPAPGKRATGWGLSTDEFRDVAQAVAEHIEQSGFTVERKAPSAGHSTP